MWMSFVPVARMNSSAAMCCVLPTPTEAKRYSPGLAFRSARSSSMLRAGTPVFTTTTLGTTTTRPTGWMSFCASKPSLMRCGAMACPVLVATMRVWPSGAALAVKSAASVFDAPGRSEEHTSELQSRLHLVCRLLLEKKKKKKNTTTSQKQNKKNQKVENTKREYNKSTRAAEQQNNRQLTHKTLSEETKLTESLIYTL